MRRFKELINFEPTEVQKKRIERATHEVIDCLGLLTIPEKAYALKVLVDGFEATLMREDYEELIRGGKKLP